MLTLPDSVAAVVAGLTQDERFRLDDIADRDPRLCRTALYDNARDIAKAMLDDEMESLLERNAELINERDALRQLMCADSSFFKRA
jgi:hypothetical protein